MPKTNKQDKKKLEVVFLPYKASMWDSLESIWKAAKTDPDCNVVVIPVPYYSERDEKGKLLFDKPVCEASEFPDYVPITHYNDYDISKKKPDIIYTHNPYDDKQSIKMHPDYYSFNLKYHTQMLVYVPYGALGAKNLESVASRPNTPHVDKIITRSEASTKAYIDLGINPNKLLTIGTPKIDKVINTKKTGICLPDDWKRLVSNKKIVLYNMHIESIRGPQDNLWIKNKNTDLKSINASILRKLRYILTFFSQSTDVVLWWRPHPNLIPIIKFHNSDLLNEYLKIVDEFKTKKIGIFDETADLHRALTCADAYYGDDSSSLLHLFAITGKPILIQSWNLENSNDFSIKPYPNHPYENKAVTLAYFVDQLVNNKIKNTPDEQKEFEKYLKDTFLTIDGTCGQKIHDHIKESLEKIQ